MRFMNEFDIASARSRFTRASKPNRLALVLVIDQLAQWADEHSDGWAYWPKPLRAAQGAIALVDSKTNRENEQQERVDITDAEMRAAVKPIRAFLTRAGASPEAREIIFRAVDASTEL